MNAKFPPGHKALNLNGMIQKVYKELHTCVLPYSLIPEELASKKSTSSKSKKTVVLEAKRRKSATASGKLELIHVHDPSSFQQRIALNTKCLQIALFCWILFSHQLIY
jgi:hypothetical protein